MRDELAAMGEVVPGSKLVQTASNGVSKPWAMFVEAIVAKVHGTGFVMILFRRRPGEVLCRPTLLLVQMMRRMWL